MENMSANNATIGDAGEKGEEVHIVPPKPRALFRQPLVSNFFGSIFPKPELTLRS